MVFAFKIRTFVEIQTIWIVLKTTTKIMRKNQMTKIMTNSWTMVTCLCQARSTLILASVVFFSFSCCHRDHTQHSNHCHAWTMFIKSILNLKKKTKIHGSLIQFNELGESTVALLDINKVIFQDNLSKNTCQKDWFKPAEYWMNFGRKNELCVLLSWGDSYFKFQRFRLIWHSSWSLTRTTHFNYSPFFFRVHILFCLNFSFFV